jgi:hypothetical protein
MSTIHHRDHPATNPWWYGVAAAALVGILLLSMAIANARSLTSVGADTNGVTTVGTRPAAQVHNPCAIARQDALSVELAHSGCSAPDDSITAAEHPCRAAREGALSVELAHSRCAARRP